MFGGAQGAPLLMKKYAYEIPEISVSFILKTIVLT